MTLNFMTKWGQRMGALAGTPTYFIMKIWNGLIENDLASIKDADYYAEKHCNKFDDDWDYLYRDGRLMPKLHTIREDKHDRWKAGNDIHMSINNRTPNRFQFAPVIKCKSVQRIEIKYYNEEYPVVRLDGNPYYMQDYIGRDIHRLSLNDGFNSVEDFFKFFNKDFKGKIIHWTDLKY